MQQIKNVWAEMDMRKRLIAVGATVIMILSVIAMSHVASKPTMTLLYAGLESGSAGDVVRSLEQRGTQFEVRGGSIYVPSTQRDELRMTLASEGLPANGGKGYELLDSLSGFGTTSQMFDAAYWRAKEGELARTIVASPHVSQARVHIANTGSNPFQRTVEPTASVSIVPMGSPITPAQANAIRFLVSSAVTGLAVDNVAVIDANGALIGSTDATAAAGAGTDDRSQTIRERVLRLVEARVGQGNAVVEVSVETVTDTESIREKLVDPKSRVAVSTDVEERADSSTNQSGEVTVASNIPDGDAASGQGSKANTSATRERINYEISETEKEILRGPGAIKRLTVAVLINGTAATNDAGETVFQPRPEEELAAMRELISAAVGFDENRGDVITLKSMELPAVEPQGVVATSSFLDTLNFDAMSLVQIAALAIVSLILGLFVVRPILSNQGASAAALPAPGAGPDALPGLPGMGGDGFMTAPDLGAGLALDGEIENNETGQFEPLGGLPAMGTGDMMGAVGLPALGGSTDDPVDRLRSLIGERQEETVQILRGWLEENKEQA
ncbi:MULTISPECIES: flagellar basal-body MS-ring/collar protein FliF [unclassified Leisingera]|uniref:flagellar basal-body MS-ring/collar protein FliF n=1 Tax=unclassified Leisingera TaxID=2614906 RepID=UPI00057FBE84|nr:MULTISPECIES: flagellar basal-body MS-ring/collar protein FliF [unclassified Leisingera]KIC18471.1 flagellar M-ring protein FliF [Leisingera sp. ANG-DT]KIC27979.1 flagellar M-ring protein FliF [Leisingera sp. ANG-M6]